MTVIALCDNFAKALTIWRQLNNIRSVKLYLLVCNNSHSGVVEFLLQQVIPFLKLNAAQKILSIKLFCNGRLKIHFTDVHSKKTLAWVKSKSPDIGLHAMGVIYRKPLIENFRLGILNPHIGLLPQYRGRSVMEWSILYGDPAGITSFFIDEGVDTGKNIVLRETVDISKFDDIASAKGYLFSLDCEMFKKAICSLSQQHDTFIVNDTSQGKRYYVMSELFKEAVEKILKTSSSKGY